MNVKIDQKSLKTTNFNIIRKRRYINATNSVEVVECHSASPFQLPEGHKNDLKVKLAPLELNDWQMESQKTVC